MKLLLIKLLACKTKTHVNFLRPKAGSYSLLSSTPYLKQKKTLIILLRKCYGILFRTFTSLPDEVDMKCNKIMRELETTRPQPGEIVVHLAHIMLLSL